MIVLSCLQKTKKWKIELEVRGYSHLPSIASKIYWWNECPHSSSKEWKPNLLTGTKQKYKINVLVCKSDKSSAVQFSGASFVVISLVLRWVTSKILKENLSNEKLRLENDKEKEGIAPSIKGRPES